MFAQAGRFMSRLYIESIPVLLITTPQTPCFPEKINFINNVFPNTYILSFPDYKTWQLAMICN